MFNIAKNHALHNLALGVHHIGSVRRPLICKEQLRVSQTVFFVGCVCETCYSGQSFVPLVHWLVLLNHVRSEIACATYL